MENSAYVEGNEGKTDFGDAYNRPDPRAYYNNLRPLGYVIPEEAKPVFEALIDVFKERHRLEQVRLLDLGCSYGVNGALLKYDLHIEDLYQHYCASEVERLSREKLLHRDSEFIDEHETDGSLHVVGLDACEEAVKYALRAGYLDQGIVADLESELLNPAFAETVKDIDMIISTGCVGYVTETTFERLFDAFRRGAEPWVVSFVLRMFPYQPIQRVLQKRGLVTEKVIQPVFIQRRFESEEEQQHVIGRLKSLGIEPSGKETEGRYYANVFVSRPESEVRAAPLGRILEERLEVKAVTEIL